MSAALLPIRGVAAPSGGHGLRRQDPVPGQASGSDLNVGLTHKGFRPGAARGEEGPPNQVPRAWGVAPYTSSNTLNIGEPPLRGGGACQVVRGHPRGEGGEPPSPSG